ncbi:MAG: methyltransferase domain-containing protein [Devosia sp.]|nr:methyltransferase domain-containing protein [Devosia sp.]
MNPDSAAHLRPEVHFTVSPADDLSHIQSNSLDRVFTSNFLEHLPNKQACDAVLKEVLRVLKPGGRFVIMGPNITYAYREYWDFYDHYLPLSHLSLAEGLTMNGYRVIEKIDRFLPFTMAGRQPTHPALIRLYLAWRWPWWKVMGKQFLVTAEKPC